MEKPMPLSVPSSKEQNDVIAKITVGLAQARRGEGRTLEEVLSELEGEDDRG
jgi:hypothetical protein